jgi:hypothetical protein
MYLSILQIAKHMRAEVMRTATHKQWYLCDFLLKERKLLFSCSSISNKKLQQHNYYILITYSVTHRPIARQQLGKNIPAEAYACNNRTPIAKQRISREAFWKIESLCFLRGPHRGVLKGQKRSLELEVVEIWVEFWRWHSKVTELMWQEMN